jgi:tetratricopeptide (TPR) repeat protein
MAPAAEREVTRIMPWTVRSSLSAAAALLSAAPLFAQPAPAAGDRPTPHVPLKVATRQELDHLEALKLYAQGGVHEHNNRLAEAARAYEAAARLDPDAAPVHRALAPIYVALDRVEDALAACRRVLELDPGDFETAYQYARHLRNLDRPREARDVLAKAAGLPGLKERPDLRAQVCFDLAVLHEGAGEWAEAERRLEEVADILDHPAALIEQGPYSREDVIAQAAETLERLGRVGLKAGHPDKAVAAFRRAQEKDPSRAARLSLNLAHVFEQQGKLREALESAEAYLRTRPQGTEGYELRAALQRKAGREADVLPALSAAASADPHNTALKLLLAREQRRAGRGREAETLYGELLRDAPAPEVYRGLFDLYKEDRNWGGERVLKRLDTALRVAASDDDKDKPRREPEAAHARAMLMVLRGDPDLVQRLLRAAHQRLLTRGGEQPHYGTRMILAGLAARTRQLDVAEALYRSCLNLPGRARGIEHEVYVGLVLVLAQANKHEAVIQACLDGQKRSKATNQVFFHLHLARALMALNRGREAVADIDEAVRTAGAADKLHCQCARVNILSQCGRHDEAIRECQVLFREYNAAGAVRDLRLTLSGAYQEAGKHAESEAQLQKILEDDATDATACNNLGYQWADRNARLDEAERLIRKAIDLDRRQRSEGTAAGIDGDRDNAGYVDSLGWVLFRKGRLEEARRELERAAALPGDDDPVVWDHLGDVCFRQGQAPKAAESWQKALALYDAGARRIDDRYKEIKDKLRLLAP